MIFLDTETCGLYGPIVLLQYAEDGGPVILHEPWTSTIGDTLSLIESIATHPGGVVGFNLTFDWFHLCQMYTTLVELCNEVPAGEVLEDHVTAYALAEERARLTGPCLKPVTACDLLLQARKGCYQSTMERSDIRIRRVPGALSAKLAAELERRVRPGAVYFSRRKDKKAPLWTVRDILDRDGSLVEGFQDVVMSFAPRASLKVLAQDALGLEEDSLALFVDVEVDEELRPVELGYAPYALAVGDPGNWRGAWPEVIRYHVDHWATNAPAREYAAKDVELTRSLYHCDKFGTPPLGDDDSILACCVAACRWRGYKVDVPAMEDLRDKALARQGTTPQAPIPAAKYIKQAMSPIELLGWKGHTQKVYLEEIAKWAPRPCPNCLGLGAVDPDYVDPEWEDGECPYEEKLTCPECLGVAPSDAHPAALRAREVLEARKAKKEAELYDKLIRARRFHASFNVIGTLSSRMSGTDKLNPQGINRAKGVRKCFPLADAGWELWGGDFAGFEVVLAAAVYKDPDLRRDLERLRPCLKCTKGAFDRPCAACSGTGVVGETLLCPACFHLHPVPGCDDCKGSGLTKTKIHALFGMCVYPHMSYEQIMKDKEIYTKCKSSVFLKLYGGTAKGMADKLGVPLETAEDAEKKWCARYPGVSTAQQRVKDAFTALAQEEGRGAIRWKDPANAIAAITGFERDFTLENRVILELYRLAEEPPAAWHEAKGTIRRDRKKEREQTPSGATRSALYGAAFGMQNGNIRAAANHEIQSSGAVITKAVQRRVWDVQPPGVHPWLVQPMNIHDEILSPTDPSVKDEVAAIVHETVESYRPRVPLIEFDWGRMNSWADK